MNHIRFVRGITAAALIGLGTTAYLSYRAGRQHESGEARSRRELVVCFIPPTVALVATGTLIVASTRAGEKHIAALVAAWTASQTLGDEVVARLSDKLTPSARTAVQQEMAQRHISGEVVRPVQVLDDSGVICYETYTGRYFQAGLEHIRAARNSLNAQVINDGYASLSDFYRVLGLRPTDVSDYVGWRSDSLLEIRETAALFEEGVPCIAVEYSVMPLASFNRAL